MLHEKGEEKGESLKEIKSIGSMEVSLCQKCNSMTHTRLGMCGKCHADKPRNPESLTKEEDEGSEIRYNEEGKEEVYSKEKKKVR